MMTARWRGRVRGWWPGLGIRDWGFGKAEASGFPKWCRHRRSPALPNPESRIPNPGPSYRHQFLFLGLDHLVDVLDALVGELLDFVAAAALVVLRNLLLLERVLDLAHGVAADVADRDLGVLALVVDQLGEPLAASLGGGGQVDAGDGAGGVRVKAERSEARRVGRECVIQLRSRW